MIKPQKALHLYLELDKKRTKIADDTFAIFEKYDGWYGMKDISQSVVNFERISSRARRLIPSLVDLSRSIATFEETKNIDLQGTLIFEILIKNVPVFKDLNGILNRSKAPCQAQGAYLMVHDLVVSDKSMPFSERYKLTEQYVSQLDHPSVRLAPILSIGGHEEVQRVAESIWKRRSANTSDEGAIGKRIDAPYSEGKRNKDIIKVKSEVTLDLHVVGMEEGQGKYAGTLGKLLVKNKAGITNGVSGMTDEERDMWWDYPELIMNKVVEVQAMQILENGSLREGRMKAVRHDKLLTEID